MARKHVTDNAPLKDWMEASEALAEIGKINRQSTAIQITMQAAIDTAKDEAVKANAPLNARKAALETALAAFCDRHREDMGDRKSKAMYFGTVGYRKTTRITLPRAATKLAEIVIRLRARGMHECVVSRPDAIDKEALRKYSEAEIRDVGAEIRSGDVFWYEVDETHLGEM